MNTLLHTPDGVRDIYGHECAVRTRIGEALLKELGLFGYDRIITPSFEFFEVFNKERGSLSSREMYKFFDRENNTLVLRPDLTPAIARCAATFFAEETMPVRLCYLGNVYRNNTNFKGRLHETEQSGAELLNDATVDADAEAVMLAIRCLRAAGLSDFQVEIGEAEFYRGILAEARLTEEEDRTLRDLIENRNSFGVEELVRERIRDERLRKLFLSLPSLAGGFREISAVRELTDAPGALAAVSRLEKLDEIISSYGLNDYVTYDLGMLTQYDYYTGIIFKAYSYGTGDYIVNGGRYDGLIRQFGKDMPAVGFGIAVDRLQAALRGQHAEIPTEGISALVVYDKRKTAEAAAFLSRLRSEGRRCVGMLLDRNRPEEDYVSYAGRLSAKEIVFFRNDAPFEEKGGVR